MPSNGIRVRLDTIAQVNPVRRVKKGQAVPFVDMAALPQGSRDIQAADIQTRDAKGAGAHFQNGDTLLARITPCLENGKTALVRNLPPGIVGEGSTEFIVLSGIEPADNEFIYYLCRDSEFRKYAIGRMEGTSGRQRVAWQSIASFEFICPEPTYRRAAAAFLSLLDDRIDLLRQTNATLESIAQALFKSWFIDFDPVRAKAEGREPEGMDAATAALFPAEFEESALGVIPKGWRVLPFLQACDLIGGAQPPASTFIDSPREGYVRLLQIRDFSSDAHVTFVPDTKKLKRASEDDVLIGRYGSASGDKAKDSLGRVCRGLSGAYNVALMKLSPIEIGSEFALQLVNAPSFYNYLQGVSAKAVQSGFSKSELGNLSVVVPPRVLADIYEASGAVTWRRIKVNRAQARSLESLRDTLLPRLISGKLRLPEAQEQLEVAL